MTCLPIVAIASIVLLAKGVTRAFVEGEIGQPKPKASTASIVMIVVGLVGTVISACAALNLIWEAIHG